MKKTEKENNRAKFVLQIKKCFEEVKLKMPNKSTRETKRNKWK